MPNDSISSVFSALADPTRRAIIARLALGEATVTELAGPFDISMPAISRHLRVMERAGLISRGRTAQFRPCKLTPQTMRQAAAWLGEYRHFWDRGASVDPTAAKMQTDAERDKKRRSNKKEKKTKKEKKRGRHGHKK